MQEITILNKLVMVDKGFDLYRPVTVICGCNIPSVSRDFSQLLPA